MSSGVKARVELIHDMAGAFNIDCGATDYYKQIPSDTLCSAFATLTNPLLQEVEDDIKYHYNNQQQQQQQSTNSSTTNVIQQQLSSSSSSSTTTSTSELVTDSPIQPRLKRYRPNEPSPNLISSSTQQQQQQQQLYDNKLQQLQLQQQQQQQQQRQHDANFVPNLLFTYMDEDITLNRSVVDENEVEVFCHNLNKDGAGLAYLDNADDTQQQQERQRLRQSSSSIVIDCAQQQQQCSDHMSSSSSSSSSYHNNGIQLMHHQTDNSNSESNNNNCTTTTTSSSATSSPSTSSLNNHHHHQQQHHQSSRADLIRSSADIHVDNVDSSSIVLSSFFSHLYSVANNVNVNGIGSMGVGVGGGLNTSNSNINNFNVYNTIASINSSANNCCSINNIANNSNNNNNIYDLITQSSVHSSICAVPNFIHNIQHPDNDIRKSIERTVPEEEEDIEDDDDDDEEEFNPWVFMKSLSRSRSITPPTNRNILPPKDDKTPKISLVLDLDETLVHCSTEPIDEPDLTFLVTFNSVEYRVFAKKRPFFEEFLAKASTLFEVIIFTASQEVYANKLLNMIDPNKYIKYRLYRDSCVCVDGNYLKDLSILGRDLSQVIIVDNSPQSFGFQVDNGIPIESWFEDQSDKELVTLISFLESLQEVDDVRPVIRTKFGLQELIDKA
ncbi:hypothetical protein SAMD00019534_034540 [Acytostelium subglobosum LB1]|uniref:hypothetical protein n=1 Tax=Acytostelium subglobosum LB1 TaxID=1410327 RepID=UPI000644EC1A|nr:hypothetical protein SAMD00019534_034540 [Acytostelium subglobosum LB1]GAM20279.1 hypothetical protein SAMD00019534_034540 [Acytostelium subglobosum LB1]|eukprot:XP_012759800.1 hypothetical protein SAMD00019534_034540 [Acytostelium subglobosum LB1]